MKRKRYLFISPLLAGLLCLMLMLSGCEAKASTPLLLYASDSRDQTSMLNTMYEPDLAKGFAQNLAVISPSKTGGPSAKPEEIDAQEIFLAEVGQEDVMQAYQIYKEMPPASLTKILNALVALQSEASLDQEYVLGDEVVIEIPDAQVCGFKPGDRITLRTLLYCMLIYSGNDAANAVASIIGNGDIPAFCESMNAEAARIGAVQTHFTTPNGLDEPNHYSTAYDLYLIFRECLKYDLFRDAIMQTGYTAHYTRDGQEITQYYASTNRFLTGESVWPEGIAALGGKTGTTDKAGTCLILYAADKQDRGYIAVLLGSPDKQVLYQSMANLLTSVNK